MNSYSTVDPAICAQAHRYSHCQIRNLPDTYDDCSLIGVQLICVAQWVPLCCLRFLGCQILKFQDLNVVENLGKRPQSTHTHPSSSAPLGPIAVSCRGVICTEFWSVYSCLYATKRLSLNPLYSLNPNDKMCFGFIRTL